jgi:type II secretory pathway pseudopilin PulG
MRTGKRHADGDSGFLMVALLIGMAVAAVYMSAALPAWRQQAQREKEEELIFRGKQYARAIMLYQDKNRGVNPPDIDILVSQHFLRKKWKDPVTGEDFVPLGVGVATPGSGSQPGTSGGSTGGQSGGGQPLTNQNPGVSGVRSKSTATSIKIYEQQQQHSLWPFDAARARMQSGRQVPQQPGQPGRGGPGGGGPDGRGGQPSGPGRGAPGGATQIGPPPPGAPPPPVGGRTGGSN